MKEKEILKLYICPKCKSHEVGYIFTFKNIFGIIPRMRCRKCCHEGIFPVAVIDLNKLKQFEKKGNKNASKRKQKHR